MSPKSPLPAFPTDSDPTTRDDRTFVDEAYDSREELIRKGLALPSRPEELRAEHLVWG